MLEFFLWCEDVVISLDNGFLGVGVIYSYFCMFTHLWDAFKIWQEFGHVSIGINGYVGAAFIAFGLMENGHVCAGKIFRKLCIRG